MGVLRQPRKIHIPTGDSNSEMSSAPENTDDESGRNTPAQSQLAANGRPRPTPTGLPALVSRNIGYRLHMKKGRRSKQRFENERLLMTMYGVDSEDYEPGRDMGKEYNSYFSDMLENHGALDDFLNQEEGKYFTIQEEGEEEDFDFLEDIEDNSKEEKVQAEDAFLRIGWRMRQALKRNVPFGMLRGIEESINENFCKDPESQYVCELSSFERLLVHALSAYYSLNSYSYDMNGKRVVKVENPRKTFNKKDPGLTDYLLLRNKLIDL
eukprot:TRINITY_DN11181_c0_g2_i2.p1 TRINITY_DN11181_c0_g2~~TRINITY_DN11181_c0_g2_i2.p1  ORF type:complete len:267 (-),score=86.30 TRINITY_DN11181_c0_g2_i2:206-1006(-)